MSEDTKEEHGCVVGVWGPPSWAGLWGCVSGGPGLTLSFLALGEDRGGLRPAGLESLSYWKPQAKK